MFEQLHNAFHRPNTTVYRWTQTVTGVLIAISILLFGAEVWFKLEDVAWLVWLDRVLLSVFGVEILLRVLSYRPPELKLFQYSTAKRLRLEISGRLKYCLQPLTLIDILTVLAFFPALRGLRALRLLRLLRLPKLVNAPSVHAGYRWTEPCSSRRPRIAKTNFADLLCHATSVAWSSVTGADENVGTPQLLPERRVQLFSFAAVRGTTGQTPLRPAERVLASASAGDLGVFSSRIIRRSWW